MPLLFYVFSEESESLAATSFFYLLTSLCLCVSVAILIVFLYVSSIPTPFQGMIDSRYNRLTSYQLRRTVSPANWQSDEARSTSHSRKRLPSNPNQYVSLFRFARPRLSDRHVEAIGPSNKKAERALERQKYMNRIWAACLIALLSLGGAVLSQSQSSDGTEKAIAALAQQWLKSQKTNNPELVGPLLADKFTNTSADGKVTDRTATLANAKATKYESADYEDVKVIVFGDTAIAIGGFVGKGTDASGKAFNSHERFTDTWVKMPGGKWQCVASHVSSVG
jgi:hypothetical protein